MAGEVRIDGIDLTNRRAIVRKIGFVPETPNLFEFFSVEYNLALFARLFQIPSSRVGETLMDFSLFPYRRNKVQTLSKGLKQRVSIGRSLLADPSILLFDEPTSGLDFEMTQGDSPVAEKNSFIRKDDTVYLASAGGNKIPRHPDHGSPSGSHRLRWPPTGLFRVTHSPESLCMIRNVVYFDL